MLTQGLRVRMAIHMGSSEGGVKGPSCRFVHHLTDLSWGGMILLSEPVSKRNRMKNNNIKVEAPSPFLRNVNALFRETNKVYGHHL